MYPGALRRGVPLAKRVYVNHRLHPRDVKSKAYGPPRQPPTHVAVDLDEVLCPFFRPFAEHAFVCEGMGPNQAFEQAYRIVSNAKTYNFSKELGIPSWKTQEYVMDFYNSPKFRAIGPIPGAVEKLTYLKRYRGCRVSVVTGRQSESASATQAFFQKFFPPRVVENIYFTNSYTDREISKADVCISIGANAFIDDLPLNCMEVCRQGSTKNADGCIVTPIDVILFGDYKWNEPHRESGIEWAKGWASIS